MLDETISQRSKEKAIFAGGCFWCTEAVFLALEGVESVVSGYIGGKTVNPTYKEICTGETGHAEAVQIEFDANVISFSDLLQVFFATHDPTTLNRQGNDIGTQYRSEVFFGSEQQQKSTEDYIDLLTAAKKYEKPIVTKITKASHFYPAEDYHQNYYNRNMTEGYCYFSITPKIEKLRSSHAALLKKSNL
jgi:peptide-methionine (S)-S-oxide reductase